MIHIKLLTIPFLIVISLLANGVYALQFQIQYNASYKNQSGNISYETGIKIIAAHSDSDATWQVRNEITAKLGNQGYKEIQVSASVQRREFSWDGSCQIICSNGSCQYFCRSGIIWGTNSQDAQNSARLQFELEARSAGQISGSVNIRIGF